MIILIVFCLIPRITLVSLTKSEKEFTSIGLGVTFLILEIISFVILIGTYIYLMRMGLNLIKIFRSLGQITTDFP